MKIKLLLIIIVSGLCYFLYNSVIITPEQPAPTTETRSEVAPKAIQHVSPKGLKDDWSPDEIDLLSAIKKSHPRSNLAGLELSSVRKSKNGYRAYPALLGRRFFNEKIEVRKTSSGSTVYWPKLSSIKELPRNFPRYEEEPFLALIKSYIAADARCEYVSHKDIQELWYIYSHGKIVPALSIKTHSMCKSPRERRLEQWIYNVENKERIKIIISR